jgi:hypothetical protein
MAVPLFADGAVNGLAKQIGLTRVPRGLLDDVQQHPAQGEGLALDPGGDRELIQTVG